MVDPSTPAGGEAPLARAERDELLRLRAEVTALRQHRDDTVPVAVGAPPGPSRGWGRLVGATALILVGCLLAPLAVAATWARSQVSDTERYVATVAPLADDPAVQREVARKLTEQIFARIDIDGIVDEAVAALGDVLPPRVATQLDALSGPLASGARSFVDDQVGNLVRSEAFSDAWAEANRAAHDELVATLSGESSSLTIEGTTVSVNLATFANAVKQRLVERGFGLAERIPEINAEFVILQSADLPKIQRGYDLLNRLGLWLPVLSGVPLLLGVYVARNHRRAAIAAGIGVALAMLLTGLGLAVARAVYLDAVPPESLAPDAAATLFDTIVGFLREGIRALGLLGLVLAAGAFLTGPSVTGRGVRGAVDLAAGAASRGLARLGVPMEPAAARVRPLRRGLVVGLVVLALAAFVVPAYPTPMLVVQITAVLLVALFLLQVLTNGPRPGPAPSEPAPLAG